MASAPAGWFARAWRRRRRVTAHVVQVIDLRDYRRILLIPAGLVSVTHLAQAGIPLMVMGEADLVIADNDLVLKTRYGLSGVVQEGLCAETARFRPKNCVLDLRTVEARDALNRNLSRAPWGADAPLWPLSRPEIVPSDLVLNKLDTDLDLRDPPEFPPLRVASGKRRREPPTGVVRSLHSVRELQAIRRNDPKDRR